jgi:dolichyl-phosphate-mannose--protein O-mannosyl transferase
MGNPVLWWLSTAAMILVVVVLVQQAIVWFFRNRASAAAPPQKPEWSLTPTELWLALFLVINYGANLLPWVRVTRCIFLYHYMGAAIFAGLTIAWLVDRWLDSPDPALRVMGIGTVLAIGLAFVFGCRSIWVCRCLRLSLPCGCGSPLGYETWV